MATNTFDIGDAPKFTASFYLAGGTTAADPDTVTFLWRTAAGVETDYVYGADAEVTKTATGVYAFAAPTITTQGKHVCRVKSTGGLTAAAELAVAVRRSSFTTP